MRLLTRKLGSLSAAITARIAALDPTTLLLLAVALLDFATPKDVQIWLDQLLGAPTAPTVGAPDQAEELTTVVGMETACSI